MLQESTADQSTNTTIADQIIQATSESAPPPPDGEATQEVAHSPGETFVETVVDVWETPLFQLNDTPIQVSQIIIALAVLALGFIFSRRISSHVGKRILPKMRLDKGASSAIESILYYTMLSVAVLVSLQIAGVPLAALAFFGGAIALGVGFGSQNVINNFISGLILLIERPIRIGDMVTVNGQTGTISSIGARATKIHSYMGSTFIVPNSIILENSVTNWFMPANEIKCILGVGVAYGSDTSKVRDLLTQAMNEQEILTESKDNQVMFVDFGDSSLNFEIHCWMHPKNTLERHVFESNLRFRIDELFREHKIEIPFPQRDLHIKSGLVPQK